MHGRNRRQIYRKSGPTPQCFCGRPDLTKCKRRLQPLPWSSADHGCKCSILRLLDWNGTSESKCHIKNVAPKKIPMRPPAIDTPSLSPFARMRMPSRANSKASPTKLDAVLILSNRLWVSISFSFLFATFVRLQGLRQIPPAVVTVAMENFSPKTEDKRVRQLEGNSRHPGRTLHEIGYV